ncbi:MAG TPA: YbaK/EbsC family protein [Terrimesophilobacter sp.]|nr:YbaK/EbsC family protein [Terrimesophilobacter sp.]
MTPFADALAAAGIDSPIVTMDDSTHTAAQAAAAIGCELGQIVKSLVFVADDEPLLVLVAGTNRVDERLLGDNLGAAIGKADAALVKDATGYSIGGVPPFGHIRPLRTVIDPVLLEFETVWAAAGTGLSVFELTPQQLLTATSAEVIPVS